MALHFSARFPSTSTVHVVVMCGLSVSYSFRIYVCMYTTLTAMQSLHACTRQLLSLSVCITSISFIICFCVFVSVYLTLVLHCSSLNC